MCGIEVLVSFWLHLCMYKLVSTVNREIFAVKIFSYGLLAYENETHEKFSPTNIYNTIIFLRRVVGIPVALQHLSNMLW